MKNQPNRNYKSDDYEEKTYTVIGIIGIICLAIFSLCAVCYGLLYINEKEKNNELSAQIGAMYYLESGEVISLNESTGTIYVLYNNDIISVSSNDEILHTDIEIGDIIYFIYDSRLDYEFIAIEKG